MAMASKQANTTINVPQQTAKILGDINFNEFVKDVKVAQLLGMPFNFKFISTMTNFTLEVDPYGAETIMIVGCMNSLLESFYLDESDHAIDSHLDKFRILFDAYVARQHLVYVCPPIGRPTTRVTTQYQKVLAKFKVGKSMQLSFI